MLHEEIFRRVGADHRFGDRDQPHPLALENCPSAGGFQRITKKPIKLMDNYDLETALLADRIGQQFLHGFALLQIAKRRVAFFEVFLGYRIAILFRPFAAGPELCLNGISLDLFLGGDPRVNDGRLLLFCVRTRADVTWIDFSEVAYAPTFPRITYETEIPVGRLIAT